MGWPKRIVMVRHAESEGNVLSAEERARHTEANHNLSLTTNGRKQAEITGEFVRGKFGPFDWRFVSYYKRARETMALLVQGSDAGEDSLLAEANRGIWNTMTPHQIQEQMPWEIQRRDKEGLYHYRPTGGENWPDVEQRVELFLNKLYRECDGANVLVVVHGFWFLLFEKRKYGHSVEWALEQYKNQPSIENASVHCYDSDIVQGKLVKVGDAAVPWKGKID